MHLGNSTMVKEMGDMKTMKENVKNEGHIRTHDNKTMCICDVFCISTMSLTFIVFHISARHNE